MPIFGAGHKYPVDMHQVDFFGIRPAKNIVSESILASQVPGGYPAVPDGPSGMLLGVPRD